jgi:predicted secreted protein
MKKALNLARRYSTVDVSTGGYNIYRINGRDEPNQWQASQSIQLDSGDAGTLLNLTGELQKAGFLSGGMQFYLSREKSASLTDDLLEEALSKLIARAKRIGATLGKQSVQVAEVSHGEGGGRPPMYMNKSMMGGERMSMSAAPVAEGTDQEVQVSVHAVVYLRP